jgi:TRAP-type C4-dicarboxylate transport system substrate-binding protein
MAAVNGVVDVVLTPTAYYEGIVPVGDIALLTELTAEEERASGALEYMQELHEAAGLFLLGRAYDPGPDPTFTMVSTKPIRKLADFRGLAAGATSVHFETLAKGLGMTFTIIPFPEAYTSLERGVVDVWSFPTDVHAAGNLQEVAPYLIKHEYYAGNTMIIIGLNSWKRLPKHLQDLIEDVYFEYHPQMVREYWELQANVEQKLQDAGMEFIKFSPAEAEELQRIAYDSYWELMLKLNPEVATKLKGLLSK